MATGRYPPRREQDVKTRARPEVEHDLAGLELREHRGIAASEAHRLAEPDRGELVRRVGAAAAAVGSICLATTRGGGGARRIDHRDLLGRVGVTGTNGLSHVTHFDFSFHR